MNQQAPQLMLAIALVLFVGEVATRRRAATFRWVLCGVMWGVALWMVLWVLMQPPTAYFSP